MREVTPDNSSLLKEILIEASTNLTSGMIDFLGIDGTAIFRESLIKKVLKHASFIFTADYILENLPVFSKKHAMDILRIISEVFEDIDEAEIDDQCSMPDFEHYDHNMYMYWDGIIHESSDSDEVMSDCSEEL